MPVGSFFFLGSWNINITSQGGFLHAKKFQLWIVEILLLGSGDCIAQRTVGDFMENKINPGQDFCLISAYDIISILHFHRAVNSGSVLN